MVDTNVKTTESMLYPGLNMRTDIKGPRKDHSQDIEEVKIESSHKSSGMLPKI